MENNVSNELFQEIFNTLQKDMQVLVSKVNTIVYKLGIIRGVFSETDERVLHGVRELFNLDDSIQKEKIIESVLQIEDSGVLKDASALVFKWRPGDNEADIPVNT